MMMLAWSSLPFSLVITFFFLSTLSTSSHGAPSVFLSPTTLPTPGKAVNGSDASYLVEFPWGSTARRSVVEGPIAEPVSVETRSALVVLAGERTYRKDPLNGFKRYTGGWNIRERHYWAVSLSNPKPR